VARLNADGALDNSFSGDGKRVNSSSFGTLDVATSMTAVGGSFFVAGFTFNVLTQSAQFLVAKLNVDGGLDSTFGSGGRVKPTFGDTTELGIDVAVNPATGVVYAAGSSANGTLALNPAVITGPQSAGATAASFAVVAINPNGTLNTGFSDDGKAKYNVPGELAGASGIAVQADGKVIVAGGTQVTSTGDSNFLTVRFGVDGNLDPAFATAGVLVNDLGASDGAFQVRIAGDGKIYLVGHSKGPGGGKIAVLRVLSQAPVTITPTLSIADAQVASGAAGTATFTVTLSAVAATEVRVDFATSDGTALAGTDYSTTSGTLTIPAGQLTGTVTVPVLAQSGLASDRLFSVTLTSPQGATLADGLGQGRILAAAVLPTVSVSDAVAVSALTGGNAVFTVTLSAASAADVRVSFATVDGTAVAGTDFTSTSGVATIPAGQLSTTVTVPVAQRVTLSADRGFTVVLSGPLGATLADASGAGVVTAPVANALRINSVTLSKLPTTIVGGTKTAKGTATLVIENTGTTAVKGRTTFVVFGGASAEVLTTGSDVELGRTTTSVNLLPGRTARVTVSLKLPAVTSDRSLFVLATANGAGITTAATSLRSAAAPLSVQVPRINLSANTTGVRPIVAKFGGRTSAVFNLFNSGNVAASGKLTVELQISPVGGTSPRFTYFARTVTVSVLPGKAGRLSFSLTAPKLTDNFPPGSYELTLKIVSTTLSPDNTGNGVVLASIPYTIS
jgi:uncharacterized delta-60 repeat protein